MPTCPDRAAPSAVNSDVTTLASALGSALAGWRTGPTLLLVLSLLSACGSPAAGPLPATPGPEPTVAVSATMASALPQTSPAAATAAPAITPRSTTPDTMRAPAPPAVAPASLTVSVVGTAVWGRDKAQLPLKDTAYSVPAGALFVDPAGGADADPGSQDAPLRTLAAAVKAAPNGGTVVLRGGVYRESVAWSDKRLTLQPYPHEQAWMDGTVTVAGWVRDGAAWRHDGWATSLRPADDTRPVDPAHPMARYPDMVFVDGRPLEQVASVGEVGPSTFFVDRAAAVLYIGDDPAGRAVEAAALQTALTIREGAGTVVRGLGFRGFAPRYGPEKAMVRGYSSGLVFEDNTLAWSSAGGLTIGGENVTVRGNSFVFNGHLGLLGGRLSQSLIEGNFFAWNNTKRFRPTWESGGVKMFRSVDVTLRDNVFEQNYGHAIHCDWACRDINIVRNLIIRNHSYGIKYEKAGTAILASNVFVRNGGGIDVFGSSEVTIYNNTFLDQASDLVIQDDRRRTDDPQVPGETRDVVVENNILTGVSPISVFDISRMKSAERMVRTVDHNVYLRRAADSQPLVSWTEGSKRVAFATLDEFRARAGHERHGLAVEQSPDRVFVAVSRGDYRLQLPGPGGYAGAPLPAEVARAVGVPADGPVAPGAIAWPHDVAVSRVGSSP
jgi:mannuronan 5-epimerase